MKFIYLNPSVIKLIKSTRLKYHTLPLLVFLTTFAAIVSSMCLIDADIIDKIVPHPTILPMPLTIVALFMGFLAAHYTSEIIIRKLKSVVGDKETYDLMCDYGPHYQSFLDFINRGKQWPPEP